MLIIPKPRGRTRQSVKTAMEQICQIREEKTGLRWARVLDRLDTDDLLEIAESDMSDPEFLKLMQSHIRLCEALVRKDDEEKIAPAPFIETPKVYN